MSGCINCLNDAAAGRDICYRCIEEHLIAAKRKLDEQDLPRVVMDELAEFSEKDWRGVWRHVGETT